MTRKSESGLENAVSAKMKQLTRNLSRCVTSHNCPRKISSVFKRKLVKRKDRLSCKWSKTLPSRGNLLKQIPANLNQVMSKRHRSSLAMIAWLTTCSSSPISLSSVKLLRETISVKCSKRPLMITTP